MQKQIMVKKDLNLENVIEEINREIIAFYQRNIGNRLSSDMIDGFINNLNRNLNNVFKPIQLEQNSEQKIN